MENTSLFYLDPIPLTSTEQAVLGLGLKFLPKYCLTPRGYINSLSITISKLIRNLKLSFFFSNLPPTTLPTIPRISSAASFTPPTTAPGMDLLNHYQEDLLKKIQYLAYPVGRSKVQELVFHTLKQLQANDKIVVKPADKNLGTTIMLSCTYKKMCMEILDDKKTYVKIACDVLPSLPYVALEKIIEELRPPVNLIKSLLQLKSSSYLRFGRFYCLPKMHKTPVRGRPIVSCINTATYHASVFIHRVLSPILRVLPTVCLSSREVINSLDNINDLTSDITITCADVSSLYPSIPTDYGLRAIRAILYEFNSIVRLDRIEEEFLLRLLEWVLLNNYFEFNGQTYLQVSGTAMGTPMAVTYANLVLYYLEKDCLKLPYLLYHRYIDDLFLLAPPTVSSTFISLFCGQVPSIKLDGITVGERGVFLDLEVWISEGKINYKTYQKSINKYLYISPHSNHTLTSLKNVIKNELRRYRLFCPQDLHYLEMKNLFYHRLLRRGYRPRLLDPIFKEEINREEIIKNKSYQLINNKKLVATLSIPNIKIIGMKEIFTLPADISSSVKFKKIYGNIERVTLGRKHGKNTLKYFLHKALPPDEINSSGVDQNLEEPTLA